MKTLRIMHLVVCFVVFFPVIAAFMLWWLFVCIKAAHKLGLSTKEGLKLWVKYIQSGIEMNRDFVLNGL